MCLEYNLCVSSPNFRIPFMILSISILIRKLIAYINAQCAMILYTMEAKMAIQCHFFGTYSRNENGETKGQKRILVANEEKEKLKDASAKFVAKDFRPYNAVECEGLTDLCPASVQFGQRYPRATANDFEDAMPSRHILVGHMEKVANSAKTEIRKIMDLAKKQNGLAATTDCWTDNYQKRSYMCITIH